MAEKRGRKNIEQKIQNLRQCSVEIAEDKKAKKQRDLFYLLKVLVAVTMPISDPHVDKVTQVNGRYKLTISAGTDSQLPWGIFTRLILLWICTQAVLSKQQVIRLGKNYVDFLKSICTLDKDGKPSSTQRAAVMEQLKRLVATSFVIQSDYGRGEKNGEKGKSIRFAASWNFWEKGGKIDRGTIVLSDEFYSLIESSSVPFDRAAVKALGSSAFELDIFLWATWRVARIKKNEASGVIPYEDLLLQFGTRQNRVCDFKREFLKALENIKILWPAFSYTDVTKDEKNDKRKVNGIVLHYAEPLVPRLKTIRYDEYEDGVVANDDEEDPFK